MKPTKLNKSISVKSTSNHSLHSQTSGCSRVNEIADENNSNTYYSCSSLTSKSSVDPRCPKCYIVTKPVKVGAVFVWIKKKLKIFKTPFSVLSNESITFENGPNKILNSLKEIVDLNFLNLNILISQYLVKKACFSVSFRFLRNGNWKPLFFVSFSKTLFSWQQQLYLLPSSFFSCKASNFIYPIPIYLTMSDLFNQSITLFPWKNPPYLKSLMKYKESNFLGVTFNHVDVNFQ